MTGLSLTGTPLLVRYALRRDRVLAILWVLVLAGLAYASAAATASLYPTVQDRVSAAEALNASPAIVALYGPILDVHSLGEVAMTKLTVLYAVFVAMLFVVLVRRHTRTAEENGQTELIGGTAVGRDAPLASAVFESMLIVAGLGVLTVVANTAGGLPLGGSVAFAASWVGIGLVGTGLAAVACQFSASSRTCAASAAVMIAVFYLLRAVGDTTPDRFSWLSWLSPFGWSTQLRAYSDTRWWVLLLYLVLASTLVSVAQMLRRRRDLGAGLLAARPGPATGSPRLGDAISLSLKVHSTMLWAWTAATGGLGLVFGAMAPNVGDLLDSPNTRDIIERLGGVGTLQLTLVAAVLSLAGLVLSSFSIAVIGHSGSDEHDGRTEQVLATATSRSRSFAAIMLVSLGGSTWLLLVLGIGVTLGYVGLDGGLGSTFTDMVPAALAQAPALWVVAGLTSLLFALRSRWAVAGWMVLMVFVTLGLLGELLKFPQAVIDLSPYTHIPSMPVEEFDPESALVLTGIAVVLLSLAWWRYRGRDIG